MQSKLAILIAGILPRYVLGRDGDAMVARGETGYTFGWMPANRDKSGASYDSVQTAHHDWMGSVPGDTLLSSMSIPGTSNSWAYDIDLADSVRSQNFDVITQISSGVRYLEASLYQADGILWVSDSIMPDISDGQKAYSLTGLYKDRNDYEEWTDADGGIIGEVAQYVYYHEEEVIILRLQRDTRDKSPEEDFIKAYNMHMEKRLAFEEKREAMRGIVHLKLADGQWPRLEDVRSKVIILVDFNFKTEYGIRWNSTALHHDISPKVRSLADMEKKWQAVNRHIDAAATSKNRKLYITQAAGGGGKGLMIPEAVAVGGRLSIIKDNALAPNRMPARGAKVGGVALGFGDQAFVKDNKVKEGMNAGLLMKLNTWKNDRRAHTGVVVMEFPGKDVLEAIISLNPTWR